MRPLLIPAVALLAVALAAPLDAPAPLVGVAAPQMQAVAVVRGRDGLYASWRPVAGQALVCAIRAAPSPQQPLEPCLRGSGGALVLALPRDVNLRVAPGDTVELRAYDRRGALLALGRATVADGWRTHLPLVAQAPVGAALMHAHPVLALGAALDEQADIPKRERPPGEARERHHGARGGRLRAARAVSTTGHVILRRVGKRVRAEV